MITPFLELDFTTASLDPRVTFTRSGATATVVNSSGYIESVAADAPRFEYNPVNGQSLGLLIEEQRTNLFVRSSEFDNASWTKSGATVTANTALAPDNTTTGDKLIPDSGATIANAIAQQIVTPAAGAITISFYAKAGGYTLARIVNRDNTTAGNNASVTFSLVDGSIVTAATAAGTWSGASAQISNQGNGWYRISLTYTTTNVATRFRISFGDAGTGDGTSGIFVWGAQLEAGASPTSFIPTVASTVTRNADVATITGTNFSDFWQPGKGGALVQATPSTVSGTRPLVQFDDNTADNIIALRGNAADPELQIVDGGASQVQLDAGTIVANTPYSLTGWWQTNDCKARKDSGATVSDYTATIPTVTQARIGSDGTNYLNGTIATINYYDSFFGRPIYTRRKNKVFPSLL